MVKEREEMFTNLQKASRLPFSYNEVKLEQYNILPQ